VNDKTAMVETARSVLRDTLRRGPVSLDEIGRRMGHTRGYVSRALRGQNPLTIETMIEALQVAGIPPAEYFAALAKALAPPKAVDAGPSQAQIEETVLRTLQRLGWTATLPEDERESGKTGR
jgi:transcriptional regulator with XRE-family HTH domain